MDFRKAFDSVHRESLWNIMTAYGIPGKLITNFMCSVEYDGRYDFGVVCDRLGGKAGVCHVRLLILVSD